MVTEASNRDRPAVSVVVVTDYRGGGDEAWQSLARTLGALARQDFGGPTEFLLAEEASTARRIPPHVIALLPSLRIVPCPSSASYALKNEGVAAASAELVGILDADCVPAADWLRHLVTVLRDHPDASCVSGRTTYGGSTRTERLLALLTRSYLDPGRAGPARFVSNNNAGFRRAAFLAHPLPTDAGPFASRMQSESMLRAGGRLLFEPRMRVVHEFEGWRMETDIRRNIGYSTIITRLRDCSMPYAWLTKLGPASIPLFAVGKTLGAWRDCIRCGPHYGVRGVELALAFPLAGLVTLLELPGMMRAFRGQEITRTAYR